MFGKDPHETRLLLLEALVTGQAGGAIERQEKRGQSQFVASETLPLRITNGTRAQLEEVGFVFGENVDDLFVRVTFPPGWRKSASDHSMWSSLLDDKGRARASIFFKAAFYDRDAFMSLNQRFSVQSEPAEGQASGPGAQYRAVVKDFESIVYRSAVTSPRPEYSEGPAVWRNWSAEEDSLRAEATAWLLAYYPDWKNPLAYWD